MKKTEILVICRHEQILQTIIRLINNNPDWNGTGVTSDEEAISKFTAVSFDIVLFGNGLSEEAENKLSATFSKHSPAVCLIKHYGGGSGLLTSEIYGALA